MLPNIADNYLSNFQPKVKTPASSYFLGKGIVGKKEGSLQGASGKKFKGGFNAATLSLATLSLLL